MAADQVRILMLEDYAPWTRSVQRILKGIASVAPSGSCAAAHEAIAAGPWSGLLVDILLPDGSGLDWLATVRSNGCDLPALVLTTELDEDYVNRAVALRASYACKSLAAPTLRSFVESVAAREQASKSFGPLSDVAMRVLDMSKLTPCELGVVSAALRGTSAREFVAAREITMNTYKTTVRSVLKKMGAGSIGEIRDRVLRAAHGLSSST